MRLKIKKQRMKKQKSRKKNESLSALIFFANLIFGQHDKFV